MNDLKRKNKNKKPKLVGRGGLRGKTAGRGTKGQKARAGHKLRPEIRDQIKKYPKLRGRGKNSNKAFRTMAAVINVGVIAKAFAAGANVTPSALVDKKLVKRNKGVIPMVKILAEGEIAYAITVYDCTVTESAKGKIVAAGGTIK